MKTWKEELKERFKGIERVGLVKELEEFLEGNALFSGEGSLEKAQDLVEIEVISWEFLGFDIPKVKRLSSTPFELLIEHQFDAVRKTLEQKGRHCQTTWAIGNIENNNSMYVAIVDFLSRKTGIGGKWIRNLDPYSPLDLCWKWVWDSGNIFTRGKRLNKLNEVLSKYNVSSPFSMVNLRGRYLGDKISISCIVEEVDWSSWEGGKIIIHVVTSSLEITNNLPEIYYGVTPYPLNITSPYLEPSFLINILQAEANKVLKRLVKNRDRGIENYWRKDEVGVIKVNLWKKD